MPILRGQWEFFLASQAAWTNDLRLGTAPHIEANYGASADVMIHVITPLAYSQRRGEAVLYGFGDVEMGFIYRFVKETDGRPEIGIFPHLELPTGSTERGLGGGKARVFLPVWFMKSWGGWTAYGGGGYWINPGTGNRDYWSTGLVVTRNFTKTLTVGAELFHNSPSATGQRSETAFNVGAILAVSRGSELMISVGRDIHGPGDFAMYVAYHLLLGPVH
ncbi:MAG: transporter [Candidatus Aminicenantales bacterium]